MTNREENQSVAPIRIYFLGSGSIGVPALRRLASDPRIVLSGVGSQPDRRAGRGRKTVATAIAREAETCGLAVEKHENVNCTSFLSRLRELRPHLVVVAAFGQILKRDLLQLPAQGCFNVHASLLPRHRGAAPVPAAILAGDRKTGVSFMAMDEGLDTGPVYEMYRTPINDTDTSLSLEQRLADLAADHIVDCIWSICRENREPLPQPERGVTHARKLRKEQARIDWTQRADELERRVRAFFPWPRAWCLAPSRKDWQRLQITQASVVQSASPSQPPGTILQADNHGFIINCNEKALKLERVIPQGRKEMNAVDFLRGCPLESGTVLSGPASSRSHSGDERVHVKKT